jgi:predicted porin
VKRKREIATGLLVLAIATVFGQETPPPAQTPPDEKKDEQAAKPPVEPKASVILGWSSWNLNGNENKFRQYATAPKGFFLRELTFAPTLARHDAFFNVQAPWQDDYRLDGTIRLSNGATTIRATDNQNRFSSPDPSVLTGNTRHITAASVSQKITPDFSVSMHSQMDQQDINFPAPLDPLHQRTRIWDATAQGSLWRDGFVQLKYTDWQYWDRTNVLPDTNMHQWSAGMSHQLGERLSLNGNYTNSNIHQSTLSQSSRVEAWSFSGDFLLSDNTSLMAEMRSEKLNLPTVQNAYDRSRQLTRGRIVHHFGQGWTGQFGYSRLALERVTSEHTFVDVPKWHSFDFRVSGKLAPSLRLTAKGSRQSMEGSAGMVTEDPRALYWRNRWSGELKLDASGEFVNGYLVFAVRDNRNDVRDVRVRNQNLTFGATYQAKPELELYFESSYDMWSGTTSDPLAPDLNAYFPDGTTFTLGANWTITNRMFATGNYTLFNTSNDNPLGLPGGNIRGSFFTGSLNYKTTGGFELGLTLAPWQYSDRLYPGMGYNTGLIQLNARARF